MVQTASIFVGGTGASDSANAATNLGLGTSNTVTFSNVIASSNVVAANIEITSGILVGNPTGGWKTNAINAAGIFVNGSPLATSSANNITEGATTFAISTSNTVSLMVNNVLTWNIASNGSSVIGNPINTGLGANAINFESLFVQGSEIFGGVQDWGSISVLSSGTNDYGGI